MLAIAVLLDRRQRGIRVLMACTAAVTQLRNRVVDFRRIHLLVRTRLIVIGMASRTIRLVGRELPAHRFAVAAMTGHTVDPATMIARIIGRLVLVAGYIPVVGVVAAITFSRGAEVTGGLALGGGAVVAARTIATDIGMIETRRLPGIGAVTQLAVVIGNDVGGILSGRGFSVMATGASTLHRRVIHSGNRLPGLGVMTQVTTVAAGNMRGIFAGRGAAVVTTGAVPVDLGMIEGGWFPGLGAVAKITGCRGGDMLCSLSGGGGAIVTALATACYLVVIDLDDRFPCLAVVTGGTVVGSGDMLGILAHCGIAVVTTGASTPHCGMVHAYDRLPGRIAVAQFAAVGAGDMARILALGRRAIVAAGTVVADRRVVEIRRFPGGGAMAFGTGSRGLYMPGSLARSDTAVVTTLASALHRRVIDLDWRFPAAGAVTQHAIVGGVDVPAVLAGGGIVVVTTHAIVAGAGMIEGTGLPGAGIVTVGTLFIGGDMIRRLATSDGTIVTVAAATGHSRVIDPANRLPALGRMTELTAVVAGDMLAVLARCLVAIVTRHTVAADAGMIEGGCLPVVFAVTGCAILRGRNMARRLAGRGGIVMAGRATARYLVVIHAQNRRPGQGAVAGFTVDTAVDMTSRLAAGGLAVVTAHAVVLYRCMIEHRIIPAECTVTIAAVVAGLDMIRSLAGGGGAIMAAFATALDGKMIHPGNLAPVVALMAELAVTGGLDVIGRRL